MRIKFSLMASLVCLSLLVMAGCSSKDDNPAGPGGNNNGNPVVNIQSVQFQIPTTMSNAAASNAGAAQAVGLLTQLQAISTYSTWWTPPPTKAPASPTVDSYYWTVGQLDITLETSSDGGLFTWFVWLDGSDGERTYSDFLFIDGNQSLVSNFGSMSILNPDNLGTSLLHWDWIENQSGALNMTLFAGSGAASSNIQSTVNPDGSGMVKHSVGTALSFQASWNTSGAGSFSTFDNTGNVIQSGTWQ